VDRQCPFDDTSLRHIVVSDRRCARGGRPPHHIVPGAAWHEYSSGTNAVGTALALGRPLHIHSEEHFCEVAKPWSCTAAVIRDPLDRHIVGAVDITGPPDTVNAQTWPSPLRSDR
jgi:transcriptional regulator of acetoin/glycerol metabolism